MVQTLVSLWALALDQAEQLQHYTQSGTMCGICSPLDVLACEPFSSLPVPHPWLNKNTAPTEHSQKEQLVN